MTFTPSPQQAAAIHAIVDWYRNPHRNQPVFRLFGYAGSGKSMRGLIETVWGYAITCHKSQGSQWENVIVYDDGLGRTAEDRARWLYTAITRAEQGLAILD